ncbi:hypothetical protein [Streptomyces sp. ML-6]|uniref:hypothetical protein n=1 Tax=Streptomyces sp. ML-6 TaxID=2982693 RepID=UPI0024C0B146|nr:hypothetical protein [Streptomyces sp. ML-6]MDK0520353.1 hypothetical protein [Streptomyces sp. ML-6]
MSITLMTADERAVLAELLGTTTPAAMLAVADAVAAAAGVHRSGYSGAAVGRLLAADMLALAARLVAVEQLLDTTRRTLSSVICAANDGYDYDMSDLLWELERAGAGLTAEDLNDAEAAAEVEARAESLR